jgi:hypothetical protein
MRIFGLITALSLLVQPVVAEVPSKPFLDDFEESAVGKLPPGWTVAKTGAGDGSVWKVHENKAAPSGVLVLAQVAAGPNSLFNLCIADQTEFQNLELSVAFNSVSGKVDHGSGVVWRLVDANNYYIARFNPLERNFRLYKVVDGKRIQLATKEGLTAPADQWHTLSARMNAGTIECSLNGKMQLEAKDITFAKAGKIGLWTKVDAHTYFDKVAAKEIK